MIICLNISFAQLKECSTTVLIILDNPELRLCHELKVCKQGDSFAVRFELEYNLKEGKGKKPRSTI